jgi:predicted lipoprotein with Yx(FWY)xxD motif
MIPLGPRMYWALGTAGPGQRKRILFADTYNFGGRAVYYDRRDTATTITCTAACTRRWLPLLESELERGSLPFSARTLSYVNGPDGRQVEYDGHPLYLYAGDSSLRKMEASGDDTDGTWFAVTPGLKPAS